MNDRHKSNCTSENNKADRPRNEDISTTGENTDGFRFIDLIVIDEKFGVENKRPEQRKGVKDRLQQQQ